jgi:hypothetical protein
VASKEAANGQTIALQKQKIGLYYSCWQDLKRQRLEQKGWRWESRRGWGTSRAKNKTGKFLFESAVTH